MRVRAGDLKINMVIERDVYNNKGVLVVPKDISVNDSIIQQIKIHHITEVFVYEEKKEDTNTYSIRKRPEYQSLVNDCMMMTDQMKSSFANIVQGEFEQDEVQNLVKSALDIHAQNKNNVGMLDMIQVMKERTDDTYMHSVNVGLIAATLGKWLKWSNADCETLMACGLFHDIGKMMIPDSILKKPGKLTDEEFETIKRHPIEGYKIVRDMEINTYIKQATLLHHEKCDGSGYPFGRKGDEFDRFVKVITIADVYDAMTGNRSHRKALCPFEVIRMFEKDGLHVYEIPYILTFLKHLVSTYIRSNVILNDGRKGQVVMINDRDLANPVVMVGDEFLDLSKINDLFIDSVEA